MKTLDAFPPAMRSACEAAIAAKIFYESDFQKFVVAKMGGYGCEAVLTREAVIEEGLPPNMVNTRLAELGEEVCQKPRGHYILVRRSYPGRTYFQFVASLGDGELGTGGAYDTFDSTPSAETVLERTVGYEIYLCRKAVEADRRRRRDVAVLIEHGWQVGMELKNLRDGSTHYSTARITGIDREKGGISLYLTRRGSPTRWRTTWGASAVAEALAHGAAYCKDANRSTPQQSMGESDVKLKLL